MKLCRCPICHSDLHLEALIEDEAGRELLYQISQLEHGVAKPMVNYLGLFKPVKSNLSNTRALKILNDVLAMYDCSRLLAHCLSETVQAVRKKRLNVQNHEPLTNHNYLKSVYETQKTSFVAPTKAVKTPVERMQEDKRQSAIRYIQRFIDLGQLDHVKQLTATQSGFVLSVELVWGERNIMPVSPKPNGTPCINCSESWKPNTPMPRFTDTVIYHLI